MFLQYKTLSSSLLGAKEISLLGWWRVPGNVLWPVVTSVGLSVSLPVHLRSLLSLLFLKFYSVESITYVSSPPPLISPSPPLPLSTGLHPPIVCIHWLCLYACIQILWLISYPNPRPPLPSL
uniref:Uncharacterized protein n=1 Tax=Myotis myotis TaxID=51298 RepID=A0A7J7Z4M1_MYOMY|nr:hypothetical protein mMyoMyo1_010604 [Myotis myotis]